MITTNDIERLIDEIEMVPEQFRVNGAAYEWLKDLLEEVNKQPTTAIQVAIVKSPKIIDEI